MPMKPIEGDKQGRMTEDWLATTPEQGYDYLTLDMEFDADETSEFIDAQLKKAEKVLSTESKKKANISGVLNAAEFKQAKEAQKAHLASLQSEVDYWKKMKLLHEGKLNAEAEKIEQEMLAENEPKQEREQVEKEVTEQDFTKQFNTFAEQLKTAQGDERITILKQMGDLIIKFAKENGYATPNLLLTRKNFLDAAKPEVRAELEDALNKGFHNPAYFENGKIYIFVEGCESFGKDVAEMLAHESTHADNIEFPENVNAITYAIEDEHSVSVDELLDILFNMSRSNYYEEEYDRIYANGGSANRMLADEVIAHAVARMVREGESVLTSITNNPTLQYFINRAYNLRENERRQNINTSKSVERRHENVQSSQGDSSNNGTIEDGKSANERNRAHAEGERYSGRTESRGVTSIANTVSDEIKQKWDEARKEHGATDEIALPNGETIKGHYVLVESGAPTASHQSDNGFAETEGFPVDENGQNVNDRDYKRDEEAQRVTRHMADNYDQRAVQSPVIVSKDGVVLSGNGRTMAGEIAARQGTDTKYNDYVRANAGKYGFTEEQVSQYKHPRIVFETDAEMPYDTQTFAKFNQREQKSQSKTEQAVKMGKVVDDRLFGRVMDTIVKYDTLANFYADDNATHAVIKALADSGIIPQTEMASLFDGGKLSDQGQALVESILIGKVFESTPDAVREITEVKSMRKAVMNALQAIVTNNRLGGGYSLSDELSQAIDLVYKARQAGYKVGDRVSEFARQGNLFEEDGATVADYHNAVIMMLADVLNDSRVTQLKKVIAAYNERAEVPAQGIDDMFVGKVSKEQIINEIRNAFNYGQSEQDTSTPTTTERQGSGSSGSEQGTLVGTSNQGGEQGGLDNPRPIGKGAFGNIYDQFKGKVKAAIKFLQKLQDGEALAVLHHKDIGDISLVWGTDKAGLKKILHKHPEVIDDLQNILDEMHIVQSSGKQSKKGLPLKSLHLLSEF